LGEANTSHSLPEPRIIPYPSCTSGSAKGVAGPSRAALPAARARDPAPCGTKAPRYPLVVGHGSHRHRQTPYTGSARVWHR